eukprot:1161989-Pelagomonas_calceolata.AAC.3
MGVQRPHEMLEHLQLRIPSGLCPNTCTGPFSAAPEDMSSLAVVPQKSVRSSADLFNALDSRRAGDRVRLDILRDGRATSLTVVLGERGMAGMLEE